MRRGTRGFALFDLVAGVSVMSACLAVVAVLSTAMVRHIAALRDARRIDAFATGVLEAVIAGQGPLGVDETGGELDVPEDWRHDPSRILARIDATPLEGDLVRLAIVVERRREHIGPKVVRFETVVEREVWEQAR